MKYLTRKQAAERVGISSRTFDRLLADENTGLCDLVIRIPPTYTHIRIVAEEWDGWWAKRCRRWKRRPKRRR